jgi:hypothetical protein
MRGKGAANEGQYTPIIQLHLSTRATSHNVHAQYRHPPHFVRLIVARTSSTFTGHPCLAALMTTNYGDIESGVMLRDSYGPINFNLPCELDKIVVARYPTHFGDTHEAYTPLSSWTPTEISRSVHR